ncbi:terbinafine resistance locus protein [Neoconidiobolus thromboides FSU 785]|nr:terbinafine resistance locus protein [Neoconidiobolus thromboides FSU 785]
MNTLENNLSYQPTNQLDGRIGADNNSNKVYDTLDESIQETLLRDLSNIWLKIQLVLMPNRVNDSLKEWDLWGPLLLCLSLAIIGAPDKQSATVFTGIFVIVWIGASIVTINSKLLGGTVSFLQSVCVLGYCLFPLNIASILALFISNLFVRLAISIIGFAWATYASTGFLSSVNLPNRKALAVFPIFLFYFFISWMILVL